MKIQNIINEHFLLDTNINEVDLDLLHKLKQDNTKLSELFLNIRSENDQLKNRIKTMVITPSSRKILAVKAIKKYDISIRSACEIFDISRTTYYYNVKNNHDMNEIEKKLLQLAKDYPSFGYWKLYYLLRDEGYTVNHKRIYRLYKMFNLQLRMSYKKK